MVTSLASVPASLPDRRVLHRWRQLSDPGTSPPPLPPKRRRAPCVRAIGTRLSRSTQAKSNGTRRQNTWTDSVPRSVISTSTPPHQKSRRRPSRPSITLQGRMMASAGRRHPAVKSLSASRVSKARNARVGSIADASAPYSEQPLHP
jgi:hypothetical protein